MLNELLGRDNIAEKPALLCDTNTYAAGAESLMKALPKQSTMINLGLQVKPSVARADDVLRQLEQASCIIVYGSGALTDIGKYAAYHAGIACISIPSAASMNGYASPSASLIDSSGYKTSYRCKNPDDIIVDISRIARAPLFLTQAGLGDTLCRSSVQTDAMLSHLLTGSWYEPGYFDELQRLESELVANVSHLHRHDEAYITLLMEALLLSGDAMRRAESSVPASGAEHMIAHGLEKHFPNQMRDHLHGAHIAVTSLTASRLQQFMLAKHCVFDAARYEKQFHTLKNSDVALSKLKTVKTLQPDAVERAWDTLQNTLHEKFLPADILEKSLINAGLATDCEALGIFREDYVSIVRSAFTTRERLTILDFAAMRVATN